MKSTEMTPQVTSYEQAIDFLFQRINYERASVGSYSSDDLKLERMSLFLEKIGNPHKTIPALHLAGTKGKGSTATMLAAVLQEAGYRVGLFTSPHLHVFEERMVVNQQKPSSLEFVELINELIPVIRELDGLPGEMAPTYFEIATGLAWKYFQQKNAELVVLETGLGGRLDTTKLCEPILTFITSIGLDHTNLLGDTLEKIAFEKAGILKQNIPVISGVLDTGPRSVIEQTAAKLDAKVYQLGKDFETVQTETKWNPKTGLESTVKVKGLSQEITELQLGLPGEHQGYNAAMVATAVELLPELGWKVTTEHLKAGIAQTVCPLRTEVVQTAPALILDAAHNVASVSALLNTIFLIPARKRTVLFAAACDKDAEAMLSLLAKQFDRIILTEFQTNPRALPLEQLVQLAEKMELSGWETLPTPEEAYQLLRRIDAEDELICVTGSFFLAVEMRELIQRPPV